MIKVVLFQKSSADDIFCIRNMYFRKIDKFGKFWNFLGLCYLTAYQHTSTIVFVTSAAYIALLLCMQLVAYFGHMFWSYFSEKLSWKPFLFFLWLLLYLSTRFLFSPFFPSIVGGCWIQTGSKHGTSHYITNTIRR